MNQFTYDYFNCTNRRIDFRGGVVAWLHCVTADGTHCREVVDGVRVGFVARRRRNRGVVEF